MVARLWEVVGGGPHGGLIVREGQSLASPKLPSRLPTGALVEEVELSGERLHFAAVSGGGPPEGWVSVVLNGRELVREVRRGAGAESDPAGGPEASAATMEDLRAACRSAGVVPMPSATRSDLLAALADSDAGTEGAVAHHLPERERLRESCDGAVGAVAIFAKSDAGTAGAAAGQPPERECRRGSGDGDGPSTTHGAWVADIAGFDAYETDPYQLFGIPHDATDASIKSAFRKLSLKVHPDRCPGDRSAASRFQQLTLAKDFLLDPYQRRAFNESHGFLTPTHNVEWWSDWNDIFAEIEPDAELSRGAGAGDTGPPRGGARAGGEERHGIDVLIFGATGITGTLACMVMQGEKYRGRTWAIAGRDGRKLQLLAHKFGRVPSFQRAFRVGTRQELEQAVQSARVVLDFSGPSHDAGTAVAEACIRAGTHLVDNTGDIMFSKEVKDRLHSEAAAAGVGLLLHAGWVSTPTDFGVWHVVGAVRERLGTPTRRVDVYTYTQGFVMSGTSLLTGLKTTAKGLRNAGGPFVLGGVRPGGIRKVDSSDAPGKDEVLAMIKYPGLNIERQVVRATCGLMDSVAPYGANFVFKDWFLVVDKKAEEMSSQESAQAERLRGIGASLAGAQSFMVEHKKIPPPGWGPKERIRQETFVTKVFLATAALPPATADQDAADEDAEKVYCVMNAGPGGVGDRYQGTAAMMIEAAACLLDAGNGGHASVRHGWGTPVYHLAHLGFFERLMSLGFTYHTFDGAPSREFMQRVFSVTLPITAS